MKPLPDPLADIAFIPIPESVLPLMAGAVDPGLPIPCERPQDGGPVTLEAIIAGMLRVIIYRPEHEHAAAYRAIIKALRPGIRAEFTQAGRVKAGLKDFPVAIEVFSAVAALYPEDPVAAFNLALVYHEAAAAARKDPRTAGSANTEQPSVEQQPVEQRYVEETFHAYQRALAMESALPDLHVNYAHFLLEQENYDKALSHFEEYLRLETDEGKKAPVEKIVKSLTSFREQDGLFKEAFDCISMGREEEGVSKAGLLLEQHPDFWNAWFLKGWGLRRLGRFPEAKESFLQALALVPAKPDLLNELAIAHMELGEFEESRRRLTEAYALEPENTKILSNLGVVSLKLGRREEAAGFFRTVLEYSPKDAVALGYLEMLDKK